MKTTRLKTFETNSSSSHSIALSNRGGVSTLYVEPSDNSVTICRGEFGWGFERHSDAQAKAAYAIQSVENNDLDRFSEVKDVILEFTGASSIKIEGEGYIDHQSTETFIDSMPSGYNFKQWCKEFIFGGHTLIIDNDNH